MSTKGGVLTQSPVIYAKVTKSVRFSVSENRTLPLSSRKAERSPVSIPEMGSSAGKRFPPHRVAPSIDKSNHYSQPKYRNGIQAGTANSISSRRGIRSSNGVKTVNQNGEGTRQKESSKAFSSRERIQMPKKIGNGKDLRQDMKQQLSSPECSLPSRSEVLPPDGDSLRSESDRAVGYLNGGFSSFEAHCPECAESLHLLARAYNDRDELKKKLRKVEGELHLFQMRVRTLEQERDEAKENIQATLENLRELEAEMCQLQRDKAQLVHELHVTRRHLTRALEQQDMEIATISHVSSVFVSGAEKNFDEYSDVADEEIGDGEEDEKLKRTKEQLAFMQSEVQRLHAADSRSEELEAALGKCEERVQELKNELSEAARELAMTSDVSTQTIRRDSTFTRPAPDKTRIPKRSFVHHNSLPAISDSCKIHKVRTSGGNHHYKVECLQRCLVEKEKEIIALKMDNNRLFQAKQNLEKEIAQLRSPLGPLQIQQVKDLQTQNQNLHEQLKIVEENYRKEMVMRKKYFNIAENMKGKIRVFCRIRPHSDMQKNYVSILESPDEFTLFATTQRGRKEFNFDRIFLPEDTQEDVFQDVENLIQSAVDGYNVCIFAYGQTGSGKTYTLVGNDRHQGIGPRAFHRIFQLVKETQSKLDFRIFVSFFELYNERLIDLLKDINEEKLEIRKGLNGLVYVQGSEVMQVTNENQLSHLFYEACSNRHTAATKMNSTSSRSHLIISILIESTNKITGTILKGKLSLVDLAGSERVAKTAAVAEQLKEANSINKSLSALGDVIAALSSEQPHVPYRNNKLTLLMQDSLGGNAKTLMIVNISPSEINSEETLNSLVYASRVKQITNSATRIAESKEVARLKSIIMKLTKEERGNSRM